PTTGTMCLPPIVADTRCPAPNVMGVMATPCCKPDGMCATDLASLSLGCGNLPIGAPPAQRCDAPPAAVAGAPATGGAAGTTAAGAGAVAGATAAGAGGATGVT